MAMMMMVVMLMLALRRVSISSGLGDGFSVWMVSRLGISLTAGACCLDKWGGRA